MKLLLINPVSQFRKGFLNSDITRFPPLAYGIISSLTPDNWEVEIIDENYDLFKYKEADLVGLTGFTSSIYRAYQIAEDEELIELAYKSGCRLIFIGIEAETNAGLESTNKRLNKKFGPENYNRAFGKIRKAGIAVSGSFIFGLDTDEEEDLYNRRDYIKSFDIDCYQTGILTPGPGTQTYKRLEKEGRILLSNYPKDWEYYNVVDVTFKPANMSSDRLAEIMKEIWADIYSKKSITTKFIKTLKTTRDSTSSGWSIATNISYHNMMNEKFDMEKMDIESIIGPYKQMFKGN